MTLLSRTEPAQPPRRGSGGGLPDRVAVGQLLEAVPPSLLDEVIAEAVVDAGNTRRVPARLAAYYTLALWLWPGEDIEVIIERLFDGLVWAGYVIADPPSKSSALRARERLGAEPFRLLYRRLAAPAAVTGTEFDQLALWSLDTTPVGVSPACGFALAQVMVLADGRGSLAAASFGWGGLPMAELAERLVRSLPPAQGVGGAAGVWFAGAAFEGLWSAAGRAGAQVMAQVPPEVAAPVGERLSDGTYLSEVFGARVRIIARPGDGGRFATTLTDPAFAPADQLIWLHANRWPAAEVMRRVVGHPPPTLRSRSEAGIEQELWALLALYQAIGRPKVDHGGLPTGLAGYLR